MTSHLVYTAVSLLDATTRFKAKMVDVCFKVVSCWLKKYLYIYCMQTNVAMGPPHALITHDDTSNACWFSLRQVAHIQYGPDPSLLLLPSHVHSRKDGDTCTQVDQRHVTMHCHTHVPGISRISLPDDCLQGPAREAYCEMWATFAQSYIALCTSG